MKENKMTEEDILEFYGIAVDSCAFYPPVSEEKKAMEELWLLKKEGKIRLGITEATEMEMQMVPCLKCKERANAMISSGADVGREKIARVRGILFSNKKEITKSDKADIKNIVLASDWAYYFFVTYDKRHILSKATVILEKLNLRCVSPSECLCEIKRIMEKVATETKGASVRRLPK